MRDFARPVTVLVGLGFPHRIADPRQALLFLHNLRLPRKDPLHTAALSACLEAISGGHADAEDAFVSFVRARGLSADEPIGLAPTPLSAHLR